MVDRARPLGGPRDDAVHSGRFVVELPNSAIEALADAVSLETHPLIERAKDIGSAAVMLSIAAAALVWIVALV